MLDEIDAAESFSDEKQNPPVGRYLSRRKRLDLHLQHVCLVVLQRVAPLLEVVEVGRWETALGHRRADSRSSQLDAVPVEARPRVRGELLVDERRVDGRRVRSELADEAHHPGQTGGEVLEVFRFAVTPPEPEMAVGAVELGEVRDDARVGDDLTARVGALERSLHPPVEHRLVPGRQLFGRDRASGSPPTGRGDSGIGGRRVVVGRPHRDRRMVAERIDGGSGLFDRLLANGTSVTPLQREVLQQQDPRFVGRVVERAVGDVAVHTQRVEPELDRGMQIGADHLVGRVRRSCSRRQEVRALEEESLAVHRADPVVPDDLPESRAAPSPVADLAVDDDFDGDVDERLVSERPWPPQLSDR